MKTLPDFLYSKSFTLVAVNSLFSRDVELLHDLNNHHRVIQITVKLANLETGSAANHLNYDLIFTAI